MESVSNSVSSLQLDLKDAKERNDSLIADIRAFLTAIGARDLEDALERHRRFATAAIELPKRIERLESELARSVAEVNAIHNTATNLRTRVGSLVTDLNKSNQVITKYENSERAVRVTLETCEEFLESPMLSQFARESKSLRADIRSCLLQLPLSAEIETDA